MRTWTRDGAHTSARSGHASANTVVHAVDAGPRSKQDVAQRVLADPEIEAVLSTQALTEFFWVTTRRLAPPLSHADAAAAANARHTYEAWH